MRSSDTSNKSLKRWSRHSCLLIYSKPKSQNAVSGHAKTRRRLPHWKKDGAVYWITFRLADAIPRDKRRAFKEARKLRLKRHPEYWFYNGGASLSSVCIPAKGQ